VKLYTEWTKFIQHIRNKHKTQNTKYIKEHFAVNDRPTQAFPWKFTVHPVEALLSKQLGNENGVAAAENCVFCGTGR
jgi:hypothetical protein